MIEFLVKRAETVLKQLYESRRHVESQQRHLASISLSIDPDSASMAMMPMTAKDATAEIREQSWALRCDLAAIAAEERAWREIYEMIR